MTPTMEQLGRRLAEWRVSFLDKGLKVNAGNYKLMVGSSVGKMIVNMESGPVVSVGKECKNTLLCVQHVKSGFTSSAVVCIISCRW